MAKCLVGAAGGRVAVSGLSADKILQGTTVTVTQGAKTVAEVTGTLAPFGPNRLVAYYNGAWLGDKSRAVWAFAKIDGGIQCGNRDLDYSDSWTVDFNGTVRVTLSGHNQCRLNGSAKSGTFEVRVGDTISWWGNQGHSYVVQVS